MRLALAALLVVSVPAWAQDLDLAGSWQGTITTVGTRLQSTYSPITGMTVTPVPDLQVMPSPFGPLDLARNGTWDMPVLDYSGDWSLDGSALRLTGDLEGAPARVEVLETGPVLVIDIPLGGDVVQTVTFSRAP
jgi:hypothetical protein